MLQTLKQKPLLTSLLIVLLYACWFLSPLLFGTTDSPIHATKTMASAVIGNCGSGDRDRTILACPLDDPVYR